MSTSKDAYETQAEIIQQLYVRLSDQLTEKLPLEYARGETVCALMLLTAQEIIRGHAQQDELVRFTKQPLTKEMTHILQVFGQSTQPEMACLFLLFCKVIQNQMVAERATIE